MFSDFLHLILQFVEFLWPFKIVHQWEKGVYLVGGRVWRVVGPGLYVKIPWFIDLHEISMVWSQVGTARSDITMKDGRLISFAAVVNYRVTDPVAAFTVVHDHEHAMLHLVTGVLAEKLAEIEPDRIEANKRGRLNTSLQEWVRQEAAEFGMEVQWVRFTTFVINPKTFRVLNESASFIA